MMTPFQKSLLAMLPEKRKCEGCDGIYYEHDERLIKKVDCCPDGKYSDKVWNSAIDLMREKIEKVGLCKLSVMKALKENMWDAMPNEGKWQVAKAISNQAQVRSEG